MKIDNLVVSDELQRGPLTATIDPQGVDVDTLMRAEIRGLRKRLEECEATLLQGEQSSEENYIRKYELGYDHDGGITSKPVTSMLNEWTLA